MNREIKFRVWDKELNIWINNIGMKQNNVLTNGTEIRFHVMQFTGLQDKNGKDIYEGDLLEGVSNNPFSLGEKSIYEIAWGVDSYYIKRTLFSIQELRNYCNNNIEVVGNIYEHPHLINKT